MRAHNLLVSSRRPLGARVGRLRVRLSLGGTAASIMIMAKLPPCHGEGAHEDARGAHKEAWYVHLVGRCAVAHDLGAVLVHVVARLRVEAVVPAHGAKPRISRPAGWAREALRAAARVSRVRVGQLHRVEQQQHRRAEAPAEAHVRLAPVAEPRHAVVDQPEQELERPREHEHLQPDANVPVSRRLRVRLALEAPCRRSSRRTTARAGSRGGSRTWWRAARRISARRRNTAPGSRSG